MLPHLRPVVAFVVVFVPVRWMVNWRRSRGFDVLGHYRIAVEILASWRWLPAGDNEQHRAGQIEDMVASMKAHAALVNLSAKLIKSKDRYDAHHQVIPVVDELCKDRDFLFDALRSCLEDPAFMNTADYLTFPLLTSGDVIIQLNLFAPIRDGAKQITHDNVHHHGWRLLTTGVVSGDGYESIVFSRGCHENRTGDQVHLDVEEEFRHVPGKVKFIDSYQPHVVFHPRSLCSTLAVWSADEPIAGQGIKRRLSNAPSVCRVIVKTVHAARLNDALGLNPLRGLYYHPEGGRIVETQKYSKPFDGNRAEILGCWFKFFEQIEFNDPDYWRGLQPTAPPEAVPLIEKLIGGETIPDLGIWGSMRRRFSRTQLLQALDPSVPADAIS